MSGKFEIQTEKNWIQRAVGYIISIAFLFISIRKMSTNEEESQQITLMQISLLNGAGLDMSAACAVRANTFLHNVPPTRYTPLNPYPQFTQLQLDMRRKCEIFKYAGSGGIQQTNSLSKKQQYSLLVGNTNKASRGTQYTCMQDRTLPTLTSACDVPGPIRILTYDPSATLYNYSSQTNSRNYPSASDSLNLSGASANDD